MEMYKVKDIEDYKAKHDLFEVISKETTLKRVPHLTVGKCPLCKVGMIRVSTQKQLYHCEGCKSGGDVITFKMALNDLSFKEVLEQI